MKYTYVAMVVLSCFVGSIYTDDKSELYQAIQKDDTTQIKNLLKKNAEISNTLFLNGFTPLHLATKKKNQLVVKLLLKYNADPNFGDFDDKTPLYYAIQEKLNNIIKLLVEAKADPINIDINLINNLDLTIQKLLTTRLDEYRKTIDS